VSVYVTGRRVALNQEYRARVRFLANGSVGLALTRLSGSASEVVIGSEVMVPRLAYTPGVCPAGPGHHVGRGNHPALGDRLGRRDSGAGHPDPDPQRHHAVAAGGGWARRVGLPVEHRHGAGERALHQLLRRRRRPTDRVGHGARPRPSIGRHPIRRLCWSGVSLPGVRGGSREGVLPRTVHLGRRIRPGEGAGNATDCRRNGTLS
jgi:hypothetical protein